MDDASTPGQARSGDPQLLADPQDPLPESNWLWRRIYIFIAALVHGAFLGVILWMLHTIATGVIGQVNSANSTQIALQAVDALYNLGFWIVMLSLVDRALYLIAPSAEQAAKMLATLSAWKSGISTTMTSRVATPQGMAETTTAAGPSAAPPMPPEPPQAPATAPDEALPDYARP